MEPAKNAVEVKKNLTPEQIGASNIRALVNSAAVKNRFEEMLGKQSASFLSSIISAISTNKQLALCDPMSIISSAAIAASVNLPINPSLGFAHIVPYKGVCQFQMGWKGFIQLAMRSGQYSRLNATPVYTGQIKKHNKFTGELELDEEFEVTDFTFKNQIGYLLYFKMLNGLEKYFYMTKAETESHGRKYSASFKKGYGLWVDNFEAMALKTVVKLGLSKYGMLSVEMQKAVEADQAVVSSDGGMMFLDNDSQPLQIENQSTANDKLLALNEKLKGQPDAQPAV